MVLKPSLMPNRQIVIAVRAINERYVRGYDTVPILGVIASVLFQSFRTIRKLQSPLNFLHNLSVSTFGCAGTSGKTE